MVVGNADKNDQQILDKFEVLVCELAVSIHALPSPKYEVALYP
jgi:hypothetical protein